MSGPVEEGHGAGGCSAARRRATVALSVTGLLEPATTLVGERVSAVVVEARAATVKLTGDEVEPL